METNQPNFHLQNQPPEITFRPFKHSSNTDFDAIMKLGTDQRVNRTIHLNLFSGRDDAVRFIDTFVLPHPWFRFICFAGSGADESPIGCITLQPEDAGGGRRRVWIGYSVVAELWGRGIATEAVRKGVEVAFGEWEGVERVQAVVFLENGASERVLEKAGFRREAVMRRYLVAKGEVRDVVMYGFVC